jgi:hypothetical protein
MITKTNSQKYFLQKRKFEIAFFDHILHFETKRKNTLLTFSQKIEFFEKNILNSLQKKEIIKRKTIYNHHVLEKKKNKNFQNI